MTDEHRRLVWAAARVVALYEAGNRIDDAVFDLSIVLDMTAPRTIDHLNECPGCVACSAG